MVASSLKQLINFVIPKIFLVILMNACCYPGEVIYRIKMAERSRSLIDSIGFFLTLRLRSGILKKLSFFLFPFSSVALAAEETIKKSPVSSQLGSNVTNVSATSLVQMIIALIFVLVAIVLLGWFSKRMVGAGKSTGGRIKVLSGASVGSRERVVLIQVGEEQMLIGVAPGSVNKLHHFENPVVENVDMDPKLAPFAQKLQQLMKTQQARKKPENKESVIDASIKEKVLEDDN